MIFSSGKGKIKHDPNIWDAGSEKCIRRMKIISLSLENFRNYASCELEFAGGMNVLCGKNGAGKTNILESLYLMSLFTSPRTTKDKELVKFGAEYARVRLAIEKKFRRHTLAMQIEANGKKKVLVDGIPVKRAAELIGILGVVFFSPDEMKMVKETPAERRRFLDVGLSQQQKTYFIAISRYNKVLKQKNNLLKEAFKNSSADDILSVWDTQLAEYGSVIIERRRRYVAELDALASAAHGEISGGREILRLGYETPMSTEGRDALRAELLSKLEQSREKDKQLGFCTVGPHRDDISIEINGLDGRKFASQGQQRTIALAMKLGEVGIYEKESGEKPVLLLDDVLSELDEDRRRTLIKLTAGAQSFITCTEFDMADEAERIVKVDAGRAEAVK